MTLEAIDVTHDELVMNGVTVRIHLLLDHWAISLGNGVGVINGGYPEPLAFTSEFLKN